MSQKICIVDDDEDVRDVIKYALELEGLQTLPFSDPFEAESVLSEFGPSDLPSLMILDYYMPNMNGVDFIKLLRRKYSQTLGQIPIILSTAYVFDETFRLPDGVKLLEKPWSITDLLEVINTTLYFDSPNSFSSQL
jgi:CheY-like chemotaxis protein